MRFSPTQLFWLIAAGCGLLLSAFVVVSLQDKTLRAPTSQRLDEG